MAKSTLIGTGGARSKLVSSKAPKAEPRSRAVNPAYTSQLGAHLGNHATMKGSTGKNPATQMDGGRALGCVGPTDNVKAVGVGGGRTVSHCGSQGHHGPSAPGNAPPKNVDILSQYGRESSKGK
jgi:hypothetical protein